MIATTNLPMHLLKATQPRQVIAGWCDFVSGQIPVDGYSVVQQTVLKLGEFLGLRGDIVLAQLFSKQPIGASTLKSGHRLMKEWARRSPDEMLIQGVAVLIQEQLSKSVSKESVQNDLIPSEDEVQKMFKNLCEFIRVKARGRSIYTIHTFEGCDRIRETRAVISAVGMALPSCANFNEMFYMIVFLKETEGLSMSGFNCLVSPHYTIPNDIRSELDALRIPFIDRTLKLMEDPELKKLQFSSIPPLLENPFDLWATDEKTPEFARVFRCLSGDQRLWNQLKEANLGAHALTLMLSLLQTELDSLKKMY